MGTDENFEKAVKDSIKNPLAKEVVLNLHKIDIDEQTTEDWKRASARTAIQKGILIALGQEISRDIAKLQREKFDKL